jgi:hypothetical protein
MLAIVDCFESTKPLWKHSCAVRGHTWWVIGKHIGYHVEGDVGLRATAIYTIPEVASLQNTVMVQCMASTVLLIVVVEDGG